MEERREDACWPWRWSNQGSKNARVSRSSSHYKQFFIPRESRCKPHLIDILFFYLQDLKPRIQPRPPRPLRPMEYWDTLNAWGAVPVSQTCGNSSHSSRKQISLGSPTWNTDNTIWLFLRNIPKPMLSQCPFVRKEMYQVVAECCDRCDAHSATENSSYICFVIFLAVIGQN